MSGFSVMGKRGEIFGWPEGKFFMYGVSYFAKRPESCTVWVNLLFYPLDVFLMCLFLFV